MKPISLTGSWVIKTSLKSVYEVVTDFEKAPTYFPAVAKSLRIISRNDNHLIINAVPKTFGIPFVENLTSIGKIVAKLGSYQSGLEKVKLKELDFPTITRNGELWGAVVDLDVIDNGSHFRHTPSIWLQGEKTFLRYFVDGNIELRFDPNKVSEADIFGVSGKASANTDVKKGVIFAPVTSINIPTVNFLNNFTSRALADLNEFISR